MSELYPWKGDYRIGDKDSPVAVITLKNKFEFPEEKVAIWGPMKTENLGIEKVIANTLSNPNIRFLIICGDEVRGHKSGNTLLKLIENGIDEEGRIIGAPGAVPYIENISKEAVNRFREQVEVIDMIDVDSRYKILEKVEWALENDPGSFGEPYQAISIKKKETHKFQADMALHANISVTPWGEVSKQEGS
ncbi:MAG: tetrahydromethanopterin S-methyltransferase subunit A [Candidatus Saliniplasma sp.]